ncbi:uncharacterized protein ASCRUDRAFT_71465 [Ascoidea rubescens DSM 1968]|uniref:Uncharacterized protein n=1 Tax=Ascoidea rubescens DSM 1968 TaxID=1344418 RepID=A0A1D2VCR8_9ASCO|nr:hypothetical protein ASCRUDRAFT_71465 [Ascoidea rubescens DSM 1968]ODV59498.1 hypothetical protein ASCRUDRAFT_71465 [Ascoidea rubescens DSM 1968]
MGGMAVKYYASCGTFMVLLMWSLLLLSVGHQLLNYNANRVAANRYAAYVFDTTDAKMIICEFPGGPQASSTDKTVFATHLRDDVSTGGSGSAVLVSVSLPALASSSDPADVSAAVVFLLAPKDNQSLLAWSIKNTSKLMMNYKRALAEKNAASRIYECFVSPSDVSLSSASLQGIVGYTVETVSKYIGKLRDTSGAGESWYQSSNTKNATKIVNKSSAAQTTAALGIHHVGDAERKPVDAVLDSGHHVSIVNLHSKYFVVARNATPSLAATW